MFETHFAFKKLIPPSLTISMSQMRKPRLREGRPHSGCRLASGNWNPRGVGSFPGTSPQRAGQWACVLTSCLGAGTPGHPVPGHSGTGGVSPSNLTAWAFLGHRRGMELPLLVQCQREHARAWHQVGPVEPLPGASAVLTAKHPWGPCQCGHSCIPGPCPIHPSSPGHLGTTGPGNLLQQED